DRPPARPEGRQCDHHDAATRRQDRGPHAARGTGVTWRSHCNTVTEHSLKMLFFRLVLPICNLWVTIIHWSGAIGKNQSAEDRWEMAIRDRTRRSHAEQHLSGGKRVWTRGL